MPCPEISTFSWKTCDHSAKVQSQEKLKKHASSRFGWPAVAFNRQPHHEQEGALVRRCLLLLLVLLTQWNCVTDLFLMKWSCMTTPLIVEVVCSVP